MSQPIGRNQEAAKPDPRVKDPTDGSEINSILFQALKGATRLGQQGADTKKVLLLAIEAAAKIGQPGKEAGAEKGRRKEEKKEAASQVAAKAAPKPKPQAGVPKPCRLAYRGCRENHKLDRCGMFGRMTGEQKLAIILDEQLCFFCFKHKASQEC